VHQLLSHSMRRAAHHPQRESEARCAPRRQHRMQHARRPEEHQPAAHRRDVLPLRMLLTPPMVAAQRTSLRRHVPLRVVGVQHRRHLPRRRSHTRVTAPQAPHRGGKNRSDWKPSGESISFSSRTEEGVLPVATATPPDDGPPEALRPCAPRKTHHRRDNTPPLSLAAPSAATQAGR
jgi:hypothetical protein